MSKNKCIDSKAGELLHAYELGILPISECELFEIHLLECEYCSNMIQQFQTEAGILREGTRVRQEVASQKHHVSKPIFGISKTTIARWLQDSIIFKPAVICCMVVLFSISLSLFLTSNNGHDIRSVQTIDLFPKRTFSEAVFTNNQYEDYLVTFLYYGVVEGAKYRFVLCSADDDTLWSTNEFSSFDQYDIGRLLIPNHILQPGQYRITIAYKGEIEFTREQIYRFEIK